MRKVVTSLALGLFLAWFSAAADPPQTRIVCKSGCTYSEPADAVDSITDSASDKRYTVFVYPGTYTKSITMKSYVGIVGYDPASTIILGTDNQSSTAIYIGAGITETSFTGLTIGNQYPFYLNSGGVSPPTTTTVNNCTVGVLNSSADCWYDTSMNSAHHIFATNVTLNVNADCIMPTPGSRFIGRNLTVFSSGNGTGGLIRPGVLKGGWYVDIDGISHESTITGGTDQLFNWPGALFGTTTGPVLKIRNVWSVTTTGTTSKTQTCVNVASVNGVSTTADFEFTNLDCSLTATDASQTIYGYKIGNDSDLANFRMHVQGGSISTAGPGTRADVSQDGTASGFVFEMGSNRNSGSFVGGGSVSAIVYHP